MKSFEDSVAPETTWMPFTLAPLALNSLLKVSMMTSLHEVAADRVDPSALKYDLQRLFSRRKHVDVVTDEVTKIDQKSKKVIGKNGEYPYDYAVLAWR